MGRERIGYSQRAHTAQLFQNCLFTKIPTGGNIKEWHSLPLLDVAARTVMAAQFVTQVRASHRPSGKARGLGEWERKA